MHGLKRRYITAKGNAGGWDGGKPPKSSVPIDQCDGRGGYRRTAALTSKGNQIAMKKVCKIFVDRTKISAELNNVIS